MMLFAVEHASRGGERGPHFLFPLLLVLLLGWVVFRTIRHRRGGESYPTRHGSPMQTLQDRFARGEIDREEFEHRQAVLAGADVIPPAPTRSTAVPGGTAPTGDNAPGVEDGQG